MPPTDKKRKAYQAKYRYVNSEKGKHANREWRLKNHYGITTSNWELLFVKQDRCCAICKTAKPKEHGKQMRWSTDHDHTTGKVRGILCRACNVGLGMFQDSPAFLSEALQYLKRSS